MIGKRIRHFEIQSELSSGGYGVVYRAHDSSVDRDVAIKVILPQHANKPEFIASFDAEARLVAQLEHINIVPLYSYWRDESGAYLVMRYVRGGSLSGMLAKQGALPLNVVLRLAEQIADALNAAHEAGVVHRDLKPDNILIDPRGNAYLTDFGIAKQLSDDVASVTDAVKGTIAYLSPEQIQQTQVSPQTDIYALGITLYEMLAGKHPFHEMPIGLMIMKHLQESLPDIRDLHADLPDGIDEIIQNATAKDPSERYASVLELVADLKQTVSGTAIAVSQSSAPAKKKPPSAEERNRYAMLESVRKFWVEGMLENSLHGAAMIELGMEPEMGAVEHPWNTLLRTPTSEERLPAGTRIANVFERLNGKVLILGDPGSGKTTTLLDFARDLLDRAEADSQHPIPVVFNLASWSERQPPLVNWLVEELNSKYQVPRRVGTEWVESDALLLLLDGLDEVAADRRDACVQAINAYREEHGFVDMVVCSRIHDYEALTHQLRLNGAIVIQELDDELVHDYLSGLGTDVAMVRDLIARDEQLRQQTHSPLMLSIMVLAYRGVSTETFPDFDTVEAQRKHLFDTYVQRMFEHRIGEEPLYTRQEIIPSLSWLAKQMQENSLSVFHIEGLQPTWLSEKQQQDYFKHVPLILGSLWTLWTVITFLFTIGGIGGSKLLSSLLFPLTGVLVGYNYTGNRWNRLLNHTLFGFAFGAIAGIIILGTYGIQRAFIFGAGTAFNLALVYYVVGRLMAAFGYEKNHVRLAEDLKFSRGDIKPWAGIGGLIAGSIIIIVPRFTFGTDIVPAMNFAAGIGIGAVIFCLSSLYQSGLTAQTVESREQPNQGIRTSFWNASRLTGLVLLQFAMIGLLGMRLVIPPSVGRSLGLVVGIAFSSPIWVLFGGYTTVQHVALRRILHRDGLIPLNYARFLDYAASSILLRKVGGGYVFIHRYLLEYFADLETIESNQG